MTEQIIVTHRFCGPPNSGNGGYACGLLARHLHPNSGAEVRLLRPIPLETPLQVDKKDAGRVLLLYGDKTIAEARPLDFQCELPDLPTYEEAVRATDNYIGFHEHPFPTCFVCGPDRAKEDGLRIFAGKPEGMELVTSNWIPDKTLADADGTIRDEFIWAALDCPGAFAVSKDKLPPIVLGTLAVNIKRSPRIGDKLIVAGWKMDEDGRKAYAGTALFSSDGRLYAYGRATWIRLR